MFVWFLFLKFVSYLLYKCLSDSVNCFIEGSLIPMVWHKYSNSTLSCVNDVFQLITNFGRFVKSLIVSVLNFFDDRLCTK